MSELAGAVPLQEFHGPRSFLFYGPGGSGKTFLATRHPGKRKLFLDIDERLHELILPEEIRKTISVWQPHVTLGAKEVQFVEVDRTRSDVTKGTLIKDEPKGYRRLIAMNNELLTLSYKNELPFDLVVCDSLTRVVEHLTYLVMYAHKVTNMTETLYGVVGRNLKEFINGFLQLPCDRIMIAHSTHIEKRDDEGVLQWERIRPHITGARGLREELPTMFSEVYYFLGQDRNKKKYLVQTASTRTTPARTTRSFDFEQEVDPNKIYG